MTHTRRRLERCNATITHGISHNLTSNAGKGARVIASQDRRSWPQRGRHLTRHPACGCARNHAGCADAAEEKHKPETRVSFPKTTLLRCKCNATEVKEKCSVRSS
ncbi:hypothetical protein EYC84_009599 [Monilinia fructicola]|uniref:Uncharacterized protein n=1 Tax=Monilinia fructicola TaxID=38448 RepID=A0A5M9J838_MONFR|nr:hypothetical protein EYC84_009599 [Monilinia fructicola]